MSEHRRGEERGGESENDTRERREGEGEEARGAQLCRCIVQRRERVLGDK